MKKISRRLLSVLLIIAMLIPTGMMGITSTAENTTFNNGDIIEFGSYPQSQITDEKLIETLTSIDSQWKSYGYYSGNGNTGSMQQSDYMMYRDVYYQNEKYRCVYFDQYRPACTYMSGHNCQYGNGYFVNQYYWFIFEPIEWIVLDSSKGLIVSKNILDCQAFTNVIYDSYNNIEKTIPANDYGTSTIREWLNDDFLNTAFDASTKESIKYSQFENPGYNNKQEPVLEDYIFLLSETELTENAYPTDATDYSKAQGQDGRWWRLRDPGRDSNAKAVDSNRNSVFPYGGGGWAMSASRTTDGIRPAFCLNVDAYTNRIQTPAGYNFYEDSFSFGNYSDKSLSKKYFTGLFSSANVEEIFRSHKNAGGLCCGFAYTTAAIYNDFPAATSIFNKPLIGAATYMNTLRDADKSSKINIGGNTISVSDYIKYAYVYQLSEDVMQQRLNTNFTSILIQGSENLYNSEGIFNLYNLVKNVTKDNNLGVIIWLNGFDVAGSVNPGCHTVLCVGVDEDSILIDDSNLRESNGYTDELGHLRINNDGTWIYEPYNGCYNSGNTCISYAMDYLKPYSILRTGNKVIADDYWIDDKNPGNSYIIGCEKLDNGKGLLYCDVANYQLNDIQTTEILDIGSGEKSVENTGKLYWIDADATITITNIENAGKDAEFHRSAGNTIIDAIISDGSSITFGSDDSVNINSVIKEECMISYSYCSEDENYNSNVVQLTLTGTANGTEVTATETDNGVQVTGLNNITATYETADGTDTEDIEIENGETVNIVVNDEENSVDVEWNCSHLCHNDNAFMQFIWKIINFLSKIFGASQYCDCGMKHW